MIDSSLIVQTSRSFIGVPYRHQGRTRQGLDCLGLIELTALLCGLTQSFIAETNYSRQASYKLQQGFETYCSKLDKLQHGSIALFTIHGMPFHCGIIGTDNGLGLIHAYENVGCVREHQLISWWEKKIDSIYGFPKVDYAS